MKPTIGRIVHYVQRNPHAADGVRNEPATFIHLPAIITAVWSPSCVNLQVFTDKNNSEPNSGEGTTPPEMKWITSVSEDATAQTARSWHWPERE